MYDDDDNPFFSDTTGDDSDLVPTSTAIPYQPAPSTTVQVADAIAADVGATPSDPFRSFIDFAELEFKRYPDNTYKLGVCRHCNASLGSAEDDKVMSIGMGMYLPNVCCAACSKKGIDALDAAAKVAQERQFGGIIPTEFISWDDAKGNPYALKTAIGKLSITEKKGLIIHGPTGSCKTRIMWQVVKHLLKQPEVFSFQVYDAFELSTMPSLPKEAYTAQYLFIDDLGNESRSSKWETNLLNLVRKRCDWHRPIVITTQLDGSTLKSRYFSEVAATAILRRFRDRMTAISTVTGASMGGL